MAAVASYQSPNDYNLVKEIRPFDPGYSGTMSEIATKGQYFKVAADRMKSMYDQAVGLDPQFAQNRDYLKNFMSEANKSLGKITKSDLSVMDNSAQAADVFQPLYDVSNPFNRRLLADSQINKWYQKQSQISDTYRTKDGGKEWNQNNDFYFRDAQQKYLTDARAGNLDSIDQHFQSKKGYIPYYDFKKEITDIQEACQGYSTQRRDIAQGNNLYFQETSKKGCSPTELALAFETGLSDRAKQQMAIDGYVHFKGNEDALAQKFTDIAVNVPQKQVDAIKATIAGIKDGGVSKDEQQRLTYYEQQLAALEPKLKQGKEEFEAMTKGNVIDYVKRNYDKLAGQIHFGELTNRLATAFRTDEEKNLVSTNPAGMLQLRLETDRANMYIQDGFDQANDARNHGYRMEEIEAQGDNAKELARLKGEIVGGSNGMGVPTAAFPVTGENVDIPKVTEEEFIKNNLVPARTDLDNSYAVVNQYVKKALGSSQDLGHQQLVNYITEIEKKQKKGEPLSTEAQNTLNAYNRYKDAKDNLAFVNDQIASINSQVKTNNPELFKIDIYDDKQYSNYKIRLGGGPNDPKFAPNSPAISQRDLAKAIQGETVKGFTIKNEKPKDGNMWRYSGLLDSNGNAKFVYYNGQLLLPQLNEEVYTLLNKTVKTGNENLTKIQEAKTKSYTDNYYENSPFTEFRQSDFGKDKDFTDRYGKDIQRLLNVTGGISEKSGYNVIFRDNTGQGIYVKLLDEDGNEEKFSEEEFARLRAESPVGAFIEKKPIGNGYAYYIPNVLSRYPGLPDDQTLKKYDKVEKHVRNIVTNLNQSPQFQNAIIMDSKELPVGGTSRYTGNTGIEYIISVKKEKGQPLSYVATWTLEDGTTDELTEQSMDQLLPQLDRNTKKK